MLTNAYNINMLIFALILILITIFMSFMMNFLFKGKHFHQLVIALLTSFTGLILLAIYEMTHLSYFSFFGEGLVMVSFLLLLKCVFTYLEIEALHRRWWLYTFLSIFILGVLCLLNTPFLYYQIGHYQFYSVISIYAIFKIIRMKSTEEVNIKGILLLFSVYSLVSILQIVLSVFPESLTLLKVDLQLYTYFIHSIVSLLIFFTMILSTFKFYNSSLDKAYEKIKEKDDHDYLTGVFNNRTILDKLAYEYERAYRYKTISTLAFLDIDDFRHVNEEFGYPQGDEILKKVTAAMTYELRATDILGRYGGEEFLIIMPNTTAEESMVLINRIKQSISIIEWTYPNVKVTFSIGVTEIKHSDSKKDVRALIDEADVAMQNAYSIDKDQVRIF